MDYPKNIMFGYENVNESLIVSYNLFYVEKILKNLFPSVNYVFNDTGYHDQKPGTWYKKTPKLGDFCIELNSLSELPQIISKVENTYGWFVHAIVCDNIIFTDFDKNGDFVSETEINNSYIHLDDYLKTKKHFWITKNNNNTEIFYVYFEARYTIEKTEFGVLYHLTNLNALDNIRKRGLIPKSRGNFPERVYFSENIDSIGRMMKSRFRHPVFLRLNFDKYESEIKERYVFYVDPRSPDDAVFTYDCIDPKYIQVVERKNGKYFYKDLK